jgi:hypothetical protein
MQFLDKKKYFAKEDLLELGMPREDVEELRRTATTSGYGGIPLVDRHEIERYLAFRLNRQESGGKP